MISLAAIKSFFSFSNLSVYLIIGSVLVYGYFRIEALKSERELLETQIAEVQDKNEKLGKQFTDFKTQVIGDLEEQRRISQRVSDANEKNAKQLGELYDTFNTSADGSERDLEVISIAKPGLIENRINNATKEVFDNVEKNSNFTDTK